MKILGKLKDLTVSALMRLFNKRVKKYDDILGRLNSLKESVSSTSPHISESNTDSDFADVKTLDIGDIRGRTGKSPVADHANRGVLTLDHFEVPNKAQLLNFTDIFNEAEDALEEIEALIVNLTNKGNSKPLTGHKIERVLTALNLDKLRKLKGVSGGKTGVVSTPDTLSITITGDVDKVRKLVMDKAKDAVKVSPMDLGIRTKVTTTGKYPVLHVQFIERKKFDRITTKMLKEMREYADALEAARDEAEDALVELAQKHVPDAFRSVGAMVFRHINKTIDASLYSGLNEYLYITASGGSKKGGVLDFTQYFHVDGLDAKEFASEDFYIVLTGTLREVKSKFHLKISVTSIDKFKRPGDFDKGKEIQGNAGAKTNASFNTKIQREVSMLLSSHGIKSAFHKTKLNVTVSKLRTSGILDVRGVIDVRPHKDGIYVLVNNMPDSIIREELLREIIPLLRKTLRSTKKSSFMHHIAETKSGNKMLKIINVKD